MTMRFIRPKPARHESWVGWRNNASRNNCDDPLFICDTLRTDHSPHDPKMNHTWLLHHSNQNQYNINKYMNNSEITKVDGCDSICLFLVVPSVWYRCEMIRKLFVRRTCEFYSYQGIIFLKKWRVSKNLVRCHQSTGSV